MTWKTVLMVTDPPRRSARAWTLLSAAAAESVTVFGSVAVAPGRNRAASSAPLLVHSDAGPAAWSEAAAGEANARTSAAAPHIAASVRRGKRMGELQCTRWMPVVHRMPMRRRQVLDATRRRWIG